jgi:hypothetical protein
MVTANVYLVRRRADASSVPGAQGCDHLRGLQSASSRRIWRASSFKVITHNSSDLILADTCELDVKASDEKTAITCQTRVPRFLSNSSLCTTYLPSHSV